MGGFTISEKIADDQRIRVAAIYYKAFENKLGRVMKRDGTAERFLAHIMNPDFARVAIDDETGEVIGVAGFKTTRGAFTEGSFLDMARYYGLFGTFWRATLLSVMERGVTAGELQLDGIAVAPSAQGRGVGTALISSLAEYAREHRITKLSLDVIDTNPRAKQLYERLGFAEVSQSRLGLFKVIFGFESSAKMVKSLA